MKKIYPLLLSGLLFLHMIFLLNLRFTVWPEMLSYPFLRNNGFLLYKDMIHPYPPVLTMTLSIIYKIFGYKLIVMKSITWLIILINDLLIFFIVKKLTKKNIFAFLSLIFYISTQPFLEGNQLWFDLAIVPLILLASLFFLNQKYFWSGIVFGLAALTKQTTALFLVFGFLYLIVRKTKSTNLKLFLTGPVVLFLVLVLRLITEGAVGGFLNWTIIYPFVYWSKFPGYVQMSLSNKQIFTLSLLLFPPLLLLLKKGLSFFRDQNFLLLTSYFLLSLILIYPRFSFFHFQLGLVFMSLLLGYLLSQVKVSLIFLIAYFLLLIAIVVRPVVTRDWRRETRFWGKEDIQMGDLIKNKVKSDQSLFFLGLHSGLYVLSSRLPVKPWTDNFGWYLEIPGVQEEIISKWKENPPDIIFWQEPKSGNRYDIGTYQPKKIADWLKNNYSRKDRIGFDILVFEKRKRP